VFPRLLVGLEMERHLAACGSAQERAQGFERGVQQRLRGLVIAFGQIDGPGARGHGGGQAAPEFGDGFEGEVAGQAFGNDDHRLAVFEYPVDDLFQLVLAMVGQNIDGRDLVMVAQAAGGHEPEGLASGHVGQVGFDHVEQGVFLA